MTFNTEASRSQNQCVASPPTVVWYPRLFTVRLSKLFLEGTWGVCWGSSTEAEQEETVSYFLPGSTPCSTSSEKRLLLNSLPSHLEFAPPAPPRPARPASRFPAQTPLPPTGVWPTGSPRVKEKEAFPSPVSWRPPCLKACRRLRTGKDRSSGTGS